MTRSVPVRMSASQYEICKESGSERVRERCRLDILLALAIPSSAIEHHTNTTDAAGAKIQTQRVEVDENVIADGDVLRRLARRAVGREEALQRGLRARGRLDISLLQDIEDGDSGKVETAIGNGKGGWVWSCRRGW